MRQTFCETTDVVDLKGFITLLYFTGMGKQSHKT